ncbi:MAG: PHP domain-containing protein [bacterium]
MNNYTVLHLHTMMGNGGFIDSTVKYNEYIDKAVEYGMTSIAFTEHGSIFSWYKKKVYCEEKGLKYIHGIEAYVTETLDEKVRDNYHCCLYAKNFEGLKEINKLSSQSFKRSQENRYYYSPRITFEELINTSDNIIISSACLGGILGKGNNDIKDRFIDFLSKNNHRCFLEIQPHLAQAQKDYNEYLWSLSKSKNIKLTMGTDTHCLDEKESRDLLQKSKNINFDDDENGWDLTFKNYETLLNCCKEQNCLPLEIYLEAIKNTNMISDMVEEFELDYTNKYPNICESPKEILLQRIEDGLEYRGLKREEYQERINYELETYEKNGALQFILLEDKVKKYCRDNNISYGYSRGSVSGSFIAYLLQITDINSVKWGMSFERFMSPDRVSLADIDTDYSPSQREEVKKFLFEKTGLNCCDIITYNTIALKGAIRDCGRGLEIPLETVNEICNDVENNEEKYRKKYPQLFNFVDKLSGTVVSIGSHPSGTVVTDINIEELIGTCTTSTSDFPISQIDMKEIDAQNYVKLDLLGLDNIELIQKTCELANIDWIETDKIDFNDKKVWNSILQSSCMVFQWESDFAHQIYKKLFSEETLAIIKKDSPHMTYIDLFSMGNGAIRPAGESYRDRLCKGEFNDNGHPALNEFLADTRGFIIYQETVIDFLYKFCGFTKGEADIVRRGFAKKTGTEKYLPQIKKGFIKSMNSQYGEDTKNYENLIISFLKVIEDASSYLFSKNHSHPYSMIGYVCAWLRYYYPLEFICSALNIYASKEEKTTEITEYAKLVGVKIKPIKFGKSKAEYFFVKGENEIYKGIGSIKFLNNLVAEELYELSNKKYYNFMELLIDIKKMSTANTRQLDILIKLDFFSEFGNSRELCKLVEIAETFKFGESKTIKKDSLENGFMLETIKKYSSDKNDKGKELKSFKITNCLSILQEMETYTDGLNIKDFDIKEKMSAQKDFLGYITPTGEEEDRRKLLIMDIKAVKRKKDGKQFGYGVVCTSIGSGKQNRYTIFNKTVKDCGEIKEGDIIFCIDYKKDGEYFTITNYKLIS